MRALRMNIMALALMFIPLTTQASTYEGSDYLVVSVATAVAVTVVIDDGGDGVVSFADITSSDNINADVNFAITAPAGKSVSCQFEKTSGQLHDVNEVATIWIRTTSNSDSGSRLNVVMNSCNIGDNVLNMYTTDLTSLQPNTSYSVPDLAIIVSYDPGVVSSYT